jgi:CSLREA domain-containing protein
VLSFRFARVCSVLCAVFGVVFVSPALAATYMVTRTDDPAPNGCNAGDCSLREAVLAANSSAGADEIHLPVGSLSFSGAQLDVDDDVDILGAGIDQTTLVNSLQTLLHVDGARLALTALAFDGPPLGDDPSSAISAVNAAAVVLRSVRMPIVGGFVTITAGSGPTLDIRDGDIDIAIVSSSNGSVEVSDSVLGMLLINQGDVDVHVQRTLFGGEPPAVFGAGLGLMTTGDVLIENTEFSNASQGIIVQASVPSSMRFVNLDYHDSSGPLRVITPSFFTIENSQFHDNTGAQDMPGAIFLSNNAHAQIFRSSFVDNKGDGDTGGAIHMEAGAEALVNNCTFSGNSFTADAAQAGARGGAIGLVGFSDPTRLTLVHTTIVRPNFAAAGSEGSAIGVRGAAGEAQTIVHNSILRGSCRFQNAIGGSFSNAFGNIESTGNTCGLTTPSNQVNVSDGALAIGSLADHGGSTLTYKPGANSVAIGNAEDTFCMPGDQRGYLRPIEDGCDVGSVEVAASLDRIFANGFD